MRRWIVERRLLPIAPERLTSLLVHRMGWVRAALPPDAEPSWVDVRVRVEPGPGASAWLAVVGAYPVARTLTGRSADVEPLRAAAQAKARDIAEELSREALAVLAPLPGIAPFGEPAAVPPRVRDVMDADGPVIDEDMNAADAAALLAAEGVDGAPVVDRRGRLLGVLSERDVLGALVSEAGRPGAAARAGDLCTRPALVTVPGMGVHRAAQQMLYHGVRRLVVVEDGRLAGTVTRRAVLAALRRQEAGRSASGTRTRTVVPSPGADTTCESAPRAPAR